MGSLQYSTFLLTEEEQSNKIYDEQKQNTLRNELVQAHVKKNGYVKLQSPYLGRESYYYDPTTKILYKVNNYGRSPTPTFEISNDTSVLKYNSIPY